MLFTQQKQIYLDYLVYKYSILHLTRFIIVFRRSRSNTVSILSTSQSKHIFEYWQKNRVCNPAHWDV